MRPLNLHDLGPWNWCHLTVLEVVCHGRLVKDIRYRIHWHCCDREEVVTHRALTSRKTQYERTGKLGPCIHCTRAVQRAAFAAIERPTIRPDVLKRERQTQGWLMFKPNEVWPVPRSMGTRSQRAL